MIRIFLIAIALALASPRVTAAQRVQLDTINSTPALDAALARATGMGAWCAPAYRRKDYNVWVDSLTFVEVPFSPDCPSRDAVVLLRKDCVFTVTEYVWMRPRAVYVILLCPPMGVGIPIGLLERPTQRAGR